MKVLVIIGPSGSGKSTLIRELHRREIVEVMPSWTTRPRREDESGGDFDHRFVTDEEFSKLHDDGYFLEAIDMFGFRYGLPAVTPPQNNRIPAILVRASLLGLVSIHFPNHVIYQIESSLEAVSQRLEARQIPRSEREGRLRGYADELALGRQICHRRFDTSDQLAEVTDAVERAIAEDFQLDGSSR
jgi:guanylate kinase